MWIYSDIEYIDDAVRIMLRSEQTEKRKKWAVGYHNPEGTFNIINLFETQEEAARRVHYLNGGSSDLII